ncbi:MAG TPA: phospholipid carrier-dependent glycosyltransferase, partial [Polyangia bacterium]|nr:phospholipid carrier-dependent glycosyltransferase [Polyangia bacterium]
MADEAARPEPRSLRLLRSALMAFGLAVVVQALCGFAGALAAGPCLVGGALVAALLVFVRRANRANEATSPAPFTAADGAAATALVLALASRAWDGLHRETFTYDVLSYHLHLPAAWHALGRLALIPTPFGDQAPAYAPANAELLYELAIGATGNLRLAHAGQVPFAALATLAIHATVRQLGGPRAMGFAAALAFLLIPEVWQQASGAMTDLALASFVLSSLPFAGALGPDGRRRDRVALGTALGLAAGTKYVGALMLLPIALLIAASLVHPRGEPARVGRALARAAIVVALVLATGGFWYVRNLLFTGDPTFPVTLRLGPWTLGRGLYDGGAMRAWIYHSPITDLHPLLDIFAETTVGFLASALAATLISLRERSLRWLSLFVGFVALGWLLVPYQQSRFFFCAWGAAVVLMAASSLRLPAHQRGWVWLPAIAGSALQAPTPTRWLLALVATIGAVAQAVQHDRPDGAPPRAWWPGLVRRRAGRAALMVALLLGGGSVIAWARGHVPSARDGVGDSHDDAWAFLAAAPALPHEGPGRRIAYAGSNLPLPLWGP